MTDLPDTERLYAVIEKTWPPAKVAQEGPWVIRDGQGGGKRVSAATSTTAEAIERLNQAESAMVALGQPCLFMLRSGDQALDAALEEAGYEIIDPVNLYACPVAQLTTVVPPRVTAFDIWEPLSIQEEIWAEGGIGPDRIDVMRRVKGPKTSLFGRENNRAAATGFVAIHDGVAMIHALEVQADHRRCGMGRHLTHHAAHWATKKGANYLSVLCTKANLAANALYTSLGMTHVGEYHYRIKTE